MMENTQASKNLPLGLGLLLLIIAALFVIEPVMAQEPLQEVVRTPTVKPQLFKDVFFKKLAFNLVSVFILVMFVYLPIHRKKDYFFTFLVLNILVFIIIYLLSRTGAFSSMGIGFSLMAFFSLLRLRTTTISMKDMTYLFIVLTIALVNASMSGPDHELLALNVFIIALTYGLDKDWLSKSIHAREMKLDSLEFIVPQKMESLVTDLRGKTGLDIQRIKVLSVDLVKKRAVVEVYHY